MITKIKKLGELIKTSKKILLINHIRMDGDAFGSLSAFYMILEKLGKNVKAINDEEVPESFSFLETSQIIEPNLDIKNYNPDLIISFDAASKEQLGNTYKDNFDLFDIDNFVVIDHHITNIGFGKINIIETEKSSTCEVVYDILKILGFNNLIDEKIATCLLTGINTDTNIFYNTNTKADTILKASELFRLGGDQRLITYELFRKKNFKQSKLWGEALAISKAHFDGKIVGATIKSEIFEKTGTTHRETTGLINEYFANIEGSKIAYLLYEIDGRVKGSMRSFVKDYNVSEVAQSFQGSGHIQAAGFYSEDTIEEVEKQLIAKLKELIN